VQRVPCFISLLQFYCQDYSDKGYMTSLCYLQDMQRDGHIKALGIVNFDAVRTDEICTQLGPGSIVTNQVQVCFCPSKSPRLHLLSCPTAGPPNIKKNNLMLNPLTQFSLIGTRPLHGLADVCEKHNIKLLTYGTFVRFIVSFSTPRIAFRLMLFPFLHLLAPHPAAVRRFPCRCLAGQART
jgi:hypothetical protein